ncbi:MAG TPA: DNA mismatch repair protein MutS [Candidatus Scatovivens faecipullorum]|nr:DNA mismatch repair protein MutS [Candidatus Scatovivens faecipullorum]
MAELSPMMQNYLNTKSQYKDCMLFYRLGDFYEMFFDDAIIASRELEITLTSRACGLEEKAPMCGVPYHAVEIYISRLIAKGYKVAICEQLEDPKKAKGIVKRDVIRVVTPGTVIETNMLEEKKNNYIMSIAKKGMYYGIGICDISTGDFYATQIKLAENNFEKLLDEYARYSPAELVVNTAMGNSEKELNILKDRNNTFVTVREDKNFEEDEEKLLNLYTITDGYDKEKKEFNDESLVVSAINGLLNYFTETQKVKLEHINKIKIYEVQKYMALDINARRSLELTERMRDKSKKGTLIWVLDKTSTSMGGRLLRRWINDPLLEIEEIKERLDAVKELKDNMILRDDIINLLKKVYDIERLAGKISYGNANARDMISLKNSLSNIPSLKQILSTTNSKLLQIMYKRLDELKDIYSLIERAIVDEPPISVKEGGIIKKGFNSEIDDLKEASTQGKNWIIALEAKEKERTGIRNLKVGYTKVFGYYIEITKSFLNQVPENYIRKQTLTGGERFVTEELKQIEEKILGSEEKVISLEYEVFTQIRNEIARNIERLQKSANTIANIDVLASLAVVAEDNNYVYPEVNDGDIIDIKSGRHPVIEKMINDGSFVENDTYLDCDKSRVEIITGPNMAGKSTFMRQVAIITLMAQIGSFVPAEKACIGIVDKIFTRVGASDDLSSGQSTFMVEMNEVANILKEATPKSLVILDEIGRGTSTYDGLSIAWAVAEYIADKEKIGCKTLFATHYHELLGLEEKVEGIKNFQVAVKEKGEDIIFLRKIVEGGTDESYGIHVAKLAGVPKTVVTRANKILRSLEKGGVKIKEEKESKKQVEGQFDLFNLKLADISHELDKININELTPIDALNTLVKLKEMLK